MSERKADFKEIEELILRYQAYMISTQEFCDLFERIWNFEFEKSSVSAEIFKSLDHLFDEVALFCSLPRERWEYPKYRDETEIRAAVEIAARSLPRPP